MPSTLTLRGFAAAFLVVMATEAAKECSKMEAYNTALINILDNMEARKEKIIEALKESPAGFVCLQEVWMEKDMQDILDGVKKTFKHHYSAIHLDKDYVRPPTKWWHWKDKACSTGDSFKLYSGVGFCGALNGCLSKSGFELGTCLVQNCAHVFKATNPSCVSCVIAHAYRSVFNAIKTCSISKGYHNRFNELGLVLLSNASFVDVKHVTYHPDHRQTIPRGYLAAELENGITTVCTHLSSNVEGYVEYDLNFVNYEAQQAEEIQVLGRTFDDDDTVLLGDLNTGPKVEGFPASEDEKNLAGEFVDNYDALLALGYTSPYTDTDGRCTYCNDNPLTRDYPNQILDHIMIKGSSLSAKNALRLYDDDSNAMSDHYGVGLDVCKEEE